MRVAVRVGNGVIVGPGVMEGIRVRVGEAVRVGLRVGTVGWVDVAGLVAVLTRAGDVSGGVFVDNSPSVRVQAASRKSRSKRDRRKWRWNEGCMGELPCLGMTFVTQTLKVFPEGVIRLKSHNCGLDG